MIKDKFDIKILVLISRFLILIFFFFLSIADAQNDDDIINVDSSIVVLNATITDVNGKPIIGLKQIQFKVFEDGQEQKVDFFAAEKTPCRRYFD
ncbi:MAG: hypothetical protein H0W45_06810 [Acidobacteria bacterium]|nr:hypothetical protein [Acidobacteriota bacterium]